MWTVIDIIAFNGERGIATNRLTDETVHFYASQVKQCDVPKLQGGSVALITDSGYIEHAGASFRRLYGAIVE